MIDIERRYSYEPINLRMEQNGSVRVMYGHAAVFNKRSQAIGGIFEEVMHPGCFADCLRAIDNGSKEVTCSFFQHDESLLLASTINRSLRLKEDATGLYQETDLLGDTTASKDMIAHLEAKRVNAMSFAFRAAKDGQKWSLSADNIEVRDVFKVVKLKDVSPVTHPAYLGTDVAIRSDAGKALELETLARMIIRAENGLRMSTTELETFKEFRALLDKYIPGNVEAPQDPNPAPLSLSEAKARYKNLFDRA